MICVSVVFRSNRPVALVAEGHSGYATAGKDIVCAAVSTLFQSLAVGIEDVLGVPDVRIDLEDGRGYFSIAWPMACWEAIPCLPVLVHTTISSLRGIEAQYGKFLCISEVHDHHESV